MPTKSSKAPSLSLARGLPGPSRDHQIDGVVIAARQALDGTMPKEDRPPMTVTTTTLNRLDVCSDRTHIRRQQQREFSFSCERLTLTW